MKRITIALLLAMSFPIWLSAQDLMISGRAADKATGEALIGVTVAIRGTSKGTISDLNGQFQIEVKKGTVLSVSYVGYKSQEVTAENTGTLSLQMELDINKMEQVVVIGYGTVKKSDVTGSVSVVDIGQAVNGTKNSISDVLKGRVSGVSVKKTAAPGDEGQIFIRGVGSFYTSSTPLFVIDGIPTNDTRDFKPNDIESIQVLKDASAAAIYGSRAFNGVVIITTKKGSKDKKTLEFSSRNGIQFAVKPFEMMGTDEWLAFNDEKWKNVYGQNLYRRFMPIVKDSSINTDWQSLAYQPGRQNEYDFAVGGGATDLTYRVSANYYSHDGIITGSKFDRFTGRVNSSWTLGRLKIDESVILANTRSNSRGGGAWAGALGMPPVIPVMDSLGNYALGNYNANKEITRNANPIASRDKTTDQSDVFHVIASASAELRIFDFLKYRLNLGIDYSNRMNQTETKEIKTSLQDEGRSEYFESRGYGNNRLVENLLDFKKSFGNYDISAILG